jgi:hypothetical protein
LTLVGISLMKAGKCIQRHWKYFGVEHWNLWELYRSDLKRPYLEIPLNVTTPFHTNVTTSFRGKLTTSFRGELTTCFEVKMCWDRLTRLFDF